MSGLFKGSEILQVAIEIEKNGETFYSTMAESLRDERVKELFRFLAGEERKHTEDFERMLEPVGRYQPSESYPGEYEAYVKALADTRIFTREMDPKELAEKVKTEAEAIDMALGAEKESILFYVEMKRFVPESEHGVVDGIIEQERKHLMKLSNLRAFL
jgi:rubrerythrin